MKDTGLTMMASATILLYGDIDEDSEAIMEDIVIDFEFGINAIEARLIEKYPNHFSNIEWSYD